MAGTLMLTMAACSSGTTSSEPTDDSGSTAEGSEGGYRISMVLKTNSSEFWKIIQAALRRMLRSIRIWFPSCPSRAPRLRPATRSRST